MRVFALILNNMMSNTEQRSPLAWAETREALERFEAAERVDKYEDEGPNMFDSGSKMYVKTYRKGGPLEWYNPLSDTIYHCSPPGGIVELDSTEQIRDGAEAQYLEWLSHMARVS